MVKFIRDGRENSIEYILLFKSMSIHKYKKIYLEIIDLILSNKWPVGSYMKSENELIKLFNVSRLTIRNVLSIMENEGRIKRSRGKKTLILDKRLRNKVNSELKDRSVSIDLTQTFVDFKIVSNNLKKNFTSSSSLYFIKSIRRTKKKKLYLISRAYISKEIAGNLSLSKIKIHNNLLNTLIRLCKVVFKRSKQELKAVVLNSEDSQIFQSIEGIPAISNTWYFYDDKDNLVLKDEEISLEPLKVQNNYY